MNRQLRSYGRSGRRADESMPAWHLGHASRRGSADTPAGRPVAFRGIARPGRAVAERGLAVAELVALSGRMKGIPIRLDKTIEQEGICYLTY